MVQYLFSTGWVPITSKPEYYSKSTAKMSVTLNIIADIRQAGNNKNNKLGGIENNVYQNVQIGRYQHIYFIQNLNIYNNY